MRTLFSVVNAIDSTTLTGTAVADTLSVNNLADWRLKKVWRSDNANSFTATWTADQSIGVLNIGGCNGGLTDTIQHELYDSSDSLIYDSGSIDLDCAPGYGLHFHVPDDVVTGVRKWVCTFDASGSLGSDSLDTGRAWAGDRFITSIGPTPGIGEGRSENFQGVRGQTSAIYYPGDGSDWRTWSGQWDFLSEDDRASLKEYLLTANRNTQILFIPDLDGEPRREGMIGRITSPPTIGRAQNVFPPVYTFGVTVEEDK